MNSVRRAAQSNSGLYALNTSVAVAMSLVSIAMGFLTQRVFLKTLGLEVLGLNALLTNVVGFLAMAELGFASAMVYHLYAPLATADSERVLSLLRFYRNSYRIIALCVAIVGLVIMLALPSFVSQQGLSVEVRIVFGFFLFDSIASYLFSYRRSLLYADRRNYWLNSVHLICILLMSATQIMILLVSGSYYAFLATKVIFRVIENLSLVAIVARLYPMLQGRAPDLLSRGDRAEFMKQVYGLAFHRIAAFVVLGADNIIISSILGLRSVGLYSNYYMVYVAIVSVVTQTFESSKSTIGSFLISTRDRLSALSVFHELALLNLFLASLGSTVFLLCVGPLVELWLGSAFLLPPVVVVSMSVSLFLQLSRVVMHSFKEASGVFYRDRWMPIVEATINVVISVLLVKSVGLAGIPLAVCASNLFLFCVSYPRYVYIPVFDSSWREYAIGCLRFFGAGAVLGSASLCIYLRARLGPRIDGLLYGGFLGVALVLVSISIMFGWTSTARSLAHRVRVLLRGPLAASVKHRDHTEGNEEK